MVVFTSRGRNRDPVPLAKGGKLMEPSGKDLMGIALVAHVPDDAVHIAQNGGRVSSTPKFAKVPASAPLWR